MSLSAVDWNPYPKGVPGCLCGVPRTHRTSPTRSWLSRNSPMALMFTLLRSLHLRPFAPRRNHLRHPRSLHRRCLMTRRFSGCLGLFLLVLSRVSRSRTLFAFAPSRGAPCSYGLWLSKWSGSSAIILLQDPFAPFVDTRSAASFRGNCILDQEASCITDAASRWDAFCRPLWHPSHRHRPLIP